MALVLSMVSALLCATSSAAAGRKQALLIANAGYKAATLRSPVNDAEALAKTLRDLGFQVALKTNLEAGFLRGAVRDFAEDARPGDVLFFYFSGFGLSSVGETFLLPVDAKIESDKDIWRDGASLKTMLARLDQKSPAATIVAIDAARRFEPEKRVRAEPAGLEPSIGTTNTVTIFSAAPGRIFDDQGEDRSTFGSELAEQIAQLPTDLVTALNRTRLNVARRSGGVQVPLVTSTLIDPLSLLDGSDGARRREPEPSRREPDRKPDPPPTSDRRPSSSPPPGSGDVFADCARCPELVTISPGTFEMGSNQPHQKPVHTVTISKGFAIGRFEVTFEEWDACVEDKGCDHKPDDLGWGRGRNPVLNVSWADATQYVTWLSKTSGRTYRLPSEAEWEYAARARTSGAYWWGENIGANNANCSGCNSSGGGRSRPVGSFRANAFGVYDTSGNVAEWVQDCWNDSYKNAPNDGSPRVDGECSLRVLRGGSFDSNSAQVKSAARFRYDTYVPYSGNGFRVVRELD